MPVSYGKWYIKKYTDKVGTQTAETYYPISGNSITRGNEKSQASFTISYTEDFSDGDWFGFYNDRDDSLWFKGIVTEIGDNIEAGTTVINAFCSMHDLSRISVGKLGLFDFGWRKPIQVRDIKNFNGEKDNEVPALSNDNDTDGFLWDFEAWSYGNVSGLYMAANVPFKGIRWNVSDLSWSNSNNGSPIIEILNNDKSWDALQFTDSTNQLANSGQTDFNADPSGLWVKYSQTQTYAFWARYWFFKSGGSVTGSVNVNDLELYQRVEISDPLSRIFALSADWSVAGGAETQHDVYHEFRGESFIKALGLMARYTGGVFYNASTAGTNQVGWLPTSDANLTGPVAHALQNSDRGASDYVLDISRRKVEPTATRYTLYGAGHSDGRVTAGLQSLWPLISGTRYGTGDGYEYDSSTNQLINTTAETTLGYSIHKELNIKQLSSLYASGGSREASNMLLRVGKRILEKASLLNRDDYVVTVANFTDPFVVGQKVSLDYTKGTITVSVTRIITEVSMTYQSANTARLTLSPDGYSIDQATGMFEEAVADAEDAGSYRQPLRANQVEGLAGGGGNVSSLGVEGDNLGNHVAIRYLDMGGFDITNVNLVDGKDVSTLLDRVDLGYAGATRTISNTGGNNVVLPEVTVSIPGLMSATDKAKLDSIDEDADVFVGTDLGYAGATRILTSSTGTNVTLPLAGVNPGLMSVADKTKLDGIQEGANAFVGTDLGYTATGRVITSSTGNDTQLPLAGTNAGLMSAADKSKLDGIENNAQANVGTNLGYAGSTRILTSSTGDNTTLPLAGANAGLMSAADKAKLDGIDEDADVFVGTDLGYAGATRILTSSTGDNVTLPLAGANPGLMTPADKTKLDGIEENAGVFTGTDLGYAAATRILTSSTGDNVTIPIVTVTNAGLMESADKAKLDGVADDAEQNEPTTSDANANPSTVLKPNNLGRANFNRIMLGGSGNPGALLQMEADGGATGTKDLVRAFNTDGLRSFTLANRDNGGAMTFYDADTNIRFICYTVSGGNTRFDLRDASTNTTVLFESDGQISSNKHQTANSDSFVARRFSSSNDGYVIKSEDTDGSLIWGGTFEGDLTGISQINGTDISDYLSSFDPSTLTGVVAVTAAGVVSLNAGVVNNTQLGSGAVGTGKIANNAVALSKMQQISNNRLIGNVSGGTADAAQLTAAQVRTLINVEDGAEQNEPTTADHITNPLTVAKSDINGRLRLQRLALGTVSFNPSSTLEIRNGDGSTNLNQIVVRGTDGVVQTAVQQRSDDGSQALLYHNGVIGAALQARAAGGTVLLRPPGSTANTIVLDANNNQADVRYLNLPVTDPNTTGRLWSLNGVAVLSGYSGTAIGATNWTEITVDSGISANWAKSTGTWGAMQYRLQNSGQVEIKGAITRGSGEGWDSNDIVFQLPNGFRPGEDRAKTCYLYDPGATDQGYRVAIVTIAANGLVRVPTSWSAAESLVIDTAFSL